MRSSPGRAQCMGHPVEPIPVSVVYALPDTQIVVNVKMAPGSTVEDAVRESSLPRRFAEINTRPLACAIYGRLVPLTQTVRPGDRIEILRPLQIDPKESRRAAAARARQKRTPRE